MRCWSRARLAVYLQGLHRCPWRKHQRAQGQGGCSDLAFHRGPRDPPWSSSLRPPGGTVCAWDSQSGQLHCAIWASGPHIRAAPCGETQGTCCNYPHASWARGCQKPKEPPEPESTTWPSPPSHRDPERGRASTHRRGGAAPRSYEFGPQDWESRLEGLRAAPTSPGWQLGGSALPWARHLLQGEGGCLAGPSQHPSPVSSGLWTLSKLCRQGAAL